MTHSSPPENIPPVSAWFHACVGVVGILVGRFFVGGASSSLMVVGSIVYLAWSARRAAGLVAALGIGLFEVAQPSSSESGAIRLMIYLAIVMVVSAIEVATRPDRRELVQTGDHEIALAPTINGGDARNSRDL